MLPNADAHRDGEWCHASPKTILSHRHDTALVETLSVSFTMHHAHGAMSGRNPLNPTLKKRFGGYYRTQIFGFVKECTV